MRLYPAIRIEGGLLGPDILDRLSKGELPGQTPAEFGLEGRWTLADEIAAAFEDARAFWGVFQNRLRRLDPSEVGTPETREYWVIPFLRLMGYDLERNPQAYEAGGMSFPISHRAGRDAEAPPVHIVGARQELGRVPSHTRPRLAPHALLQEFLNRTEHLWGLVTNGLTLRLLRNSTYISRQTYVEFDLAAIVEERRFEEFVLLYRLLHRTRLPKTAADASQCLLERYYQYTIEQGGRVRDRLRQSVENCLIELANGFLEHTANTNLRQRLAASQPPVQTPHSLSLQFYQELLRLVYRFLFLLVSEGRGFISSFQLYRDHYSISRLRRLVDHRNAYTHHDDLWYSLRVLWKVLASENLAAHLHLAPLNGPLFTQLNLDDCVLSNQRLLQAFRYLVYYEESPTAPLRRVNYSALDVEELGSVYESLLEYHPHIDFSGQLPRFYLTFGSERKSTGSYYTPAQLVEELIRSVLDPLIAARLSSSKSTEEKVRALLSIRVCDPAVGSGHFLLAAARRLGKELARLRCSGEPSPEQLRQAIREVITHCLYGVDKNPLAVELCRLALWLEAHYAGKPLTFLDHHIKVGDSLVGLLEPERLSEGIPDEAFHSAATDDKNTVQTLKKRNHNELNDLKSGQLRLPLDAPIQLSEFSTRRSDLESIADDSPTQVRQKEEQYRRFLDDPERQRLIEAAHLWTAAFFQPIPADRTKLCAAITTQAVVDRLKGHLSVQPLAQAQELAQSHHFFHWPLEFPEVFQEGGFDVVLGNPPFLGGLKISGTLGPQYRHWLEFAYAPFRGTADLCAAFFRRAYDLLRPGGRMGLVATNTIGQGDTRKSGLAVILHEGGVITFAKRFVKWPGAANVEVNLVTISKPDHSSPAIRHSPILDGNPVPFISSRLDADPEAEPKRLKQNEGKAFQGSIVLGMGFVLEPDKAQALIAKDPRNADCLFPYLNGEDLNRHPEQQPSRWVIQFDERPEEDARKYPDLWGIVMQHVWPERQLKDSKRYPRMVHEWWKHWNNRQELYRAIAPLRRVLVRAQVSDRHMMAFVTKGWIYDAKLIVFAFDDDYHFALLQSSMHEIWTRKFASTLRTDISYTPTDCFDTFPFPPLEYEHLASGQWRLEGMPQAFQQAAHIGAEYHEHRRQIMLSRQLGLTKTYNLFHTPTCEDSAILRLRSLHAEMDYAVLACYGWEDMPLSHGFYENDRGQMRYGISPQARQELLARLLSLNLKLTGTGH